MELLILVVNYSHKPDSLLSKINISPVIRVFYNLFK